MSALIPSRGSAWELGAPAAGTGWGISGGSGATIPALRRLLAKSSHAWVPSGNDWLSFRGGKPAIKSDRNFNQPRLDYDASRWPARAKSTDRLRLGSSTGGGPPWPLPLPAFGGAGAVLGSGAAWGSGSARVGASDGAGVSGKICVCVRRGTST